MQQPTHADAFEVLCLQAADDGRGEVLFGESLSRARTALRPFMVGPTFPSVYLEFPLIGEPFLDVTVLYDGLDAGTRIDSPAAEGTGPMLDWFSEACADLTDVCCGFELDVKDPSLPRAAIHFQPRDHRELVTPFCEAAGIAEAAPLYLSLDDRMPEGWALSFFGAFLGRPGTPLRVCGYVTRTAIDACVEDPRYLAGVFDTIGFSAYDDALLAQVSELVAVAPKALDFQLDVYPDGTLGSVFAIDAQFRIERPEEVQASFADGPGARIMGLLEHWGIADGRWWLGAQAAFARSVPVVLDDGTIGRYAFALMPQWVKARWASGVLQPAKLYHLASGSVLSS